MRYTDYKKYSIRANTEFKVKGFTFGENLSVTFDNYVGQPGGNQVEQNMVNEGLLKMQPIIPVYDEGGNWGGTKAGFGNGIPHKQKSAYSAVEFFRVMFPAPRAVRRVQTRASPPQAAGARVDPAMQTERTLRGRPVDAPWRRRHK